jgi:hypothetical protein
MTDKRAVRLGHRTAYDQPRVKRRDNQVPGTRKVKACAKCKRLLPITDFAPSQAAHNCGWCRACHSARNQEIMAKYPEKYNLEYYRARNQRNKTNNPEKHTPQANAARYHRCVAKYPEKYTPQANSARTRQVRAKNPELYKKLGGIATRRRKMKKRQRRPPWVDGTEVETAINAIYAKARTLKLQTGLAYDVDHFYPLTNKAFSGLDVPWNLRVLTNKEHKPKSNKRPELFYSPRQFQRIVRQLDAKKA